MAVQAQYLQWVLEQLSALGGLTSRRMFGGVGLYRDGIFFAIIMSDTLYFKVNDATRADYESRGMRQFAPRDRARGSSRYYELPLDILEDSDKCIEWARRALAAAGP